MKAKFINNQLYVSPDLYKEILSMYGSEQYRGRKVAIKTNNSFASRMIAEKKMFDDETWHKLVPITSQNNDRMALQMEAYWTLCKEFDITYEGHIPQFYYQWFKNRGLIKESVMNEGAIGDAFKDGDTIEILISKYRGGPKWNFMEYNTKWKQISSVGTGPENLIGRGKKIKLSNAMRKQIAAAVKKEMQREDDFFSTNNVYKDEVEYALREDRIPKLKDLIPEASEWYEVYDNGNEMLKAFERPGGKWYADIGNRYDKEFKSRQELDRFLKKNKFKYIGVDKH